MLESDNYIESGNYIFLGREGSLGYHRNQTYKLKIRLGQYYGKTVIFIECKTNPKGLCPYTNPTNFYKNWAKESTT